MTFKRHEAVSTRFNPYNSAWAREYGREDVQDIPVDEDALEILEKTLEIYSFNNRQSEVFNAHPNNERPQKSCLELPLPEGADPHGPVLQLASAGVRRFGFFSVLSIDSAEPLRSWRTTEQMAGWIEGIDARHSLDTGAVLFVERSEDADDHLLSPRLNRLRAAVTKLTVPRLAIITTAIPEEAPPLEETVLDAGMLRPETSDPGPGMGLL